MASVNDEGDIDDTIATGNPLIDGLLGEYHWSYLARANFQFTIPDSSADYEDTRDLLVDDYPDDNSEYVHAMPGYMAGIISDVIAQYNTVLNFAIAEQGDNNVDTQLRYGIADLHHDGVQPPPNAYAWMPKDDGLFSEKENWKSGDIFLNEDAFTNPPMFGSSPFAEMVGTYAYHTMLHETGHALGLKHGHTVDEDTGNPALPTAWDGMEFSVMTYRDYPGQTIADGYKTVAGNYAQTLMMLDIQALQSMYGADYSTQSGDTVYRWDTAGKYTINDAAQWTTDTGVIFLTIWDGGGSDTYDFSAFATDETVDLAPGSWSNLGRQIADLGDVDARANVYNAFEYQNNPASLIENAIGGGGDDRIDGNVAANRLDGGTGLDILYGLDGDDTLKGGTGGDLLDAGAGNDTALYDDPAGAHIDIRVVDAGLGRWLVTGPLQGIGDDLDGIERFGFGNGSDIVTTSGATGGVSFDFDGLDGDDSLAAGDGSDVLTGSGGSDTLDVGKGVFHAYGGTPYIVYVGSQPQQRWHESLAEDDRLVIDRSTTTSYFKLYFDRTVGDVGAFIGNDGSYARGIAGIYYTGGLAKDEIYGGFGGDSITGEDGGDLLTGNDGDDHLYGGDSDDTLFGNDGNDTLNGGAGGDRMSGGAGADRIEMGAGDYIANGQDGNDVVIGSTSGDWLTGEAGNDTLIAGDGNDTLYAGDGDDSLVGGAGNDSLNSGLGVEDIDGGEGSDYLSMYRGATTLGVSFYLNGAVGSDGSRSTGVESMTYTGGSGNDIVAGWDNADTISAGLGNDRLDGGGGDDNMHGDDGNDTLVGGAGGDRMWGGNGNDRIEAGVGDFLLNGEAGNDLIVGSTASDWLTGGGENDTLQGGDGADTLRGEAGNDSLLAGAGDDNIDPGLGVEKIDGGAGYDYLTINRSSTTPGVTFYLNGAVGSDGTRATGIEAMTYTAGSGSDTVVGWDNGDNISGRNGNDRLEGGGGDDTLFGEDGNDTLVGGGGGDRMYGGYGNDRIEMGAGDYIANGEAGNDLVIGSSAGDVLNGNADNDTLQGGGGNDTLNADVGDDVLDGGAGDDTLRGGDGLDTASYATASAGVTVSLLLGGQNTGGGGTDLLSGFENLAGSAFADALIGNGDANALTGGAGNDTLTGGAGNDTLAGGTGDDLAVYAAASVAVTVKLALTGAQDTGGAGTDTLSGVESVSGSAFGDNLQGSNAANLLLGGDGDDTLLGGLGDDYLLGAGGRDTASYITATAGVTVDLALTVAQNTGAAGMDRILQVENLRGSAHGDTLKGNAATNSIVAAEGNDVVYGFAGNDTLTGGTGLDTLYGGDAQDTIQGGDGDDTVWGEGGLDGIKGDAGNDTLHGGIDNDTINGGAGNDKLYGEAGRDILTGDVGADRFVYATLAESPDTATGRDRINDFSHSQGDKIDLSAIDAVAGAGDNAFTFVGAIAFTGVAGQLNAIASGSNWIVRGDIDGNGIADFAIQVTSTTALVATDFVL